MGGHQLTTMAKQLSLVAVLLCVAAAETFPLFAWTGFKPSGESFLGADSDSAHQFLAANQARFKGSVVFLHSLSTQELAATPATTRMMQQTIDQSAASIFRPLTGPTDPTQLGDGEVKQVSGKEALGFLAEHPEFLADGAHRTLVVDLRQMEAELESITAADQLRQQITQAAHQATEGEYLAVVTSSGRSAGRRLLWLDTHNSMPTGTTAAIWNFYPRPTGGAYYTNPNMVLGLGAMAYMMLIAFCGFCCLFQLQTQTCLRVTRRRRWTGLLGTRAATS